MTDDYPALLARLAKVRQVDATGAADARARLDRDRRAVLALRNALEDEAGEIRDHAHLLSTPVPDLRAPADPTARPDSLDAELREGREALARATAARQEAVAAGRQPSFLPRAHHLARNAVIYLAALAAVLVVQLGLHAASKDDARLWIACLPPVAGVLAGYIAVGVVSRPRVPTLDKFGKVIDFKVYKSPRLGVAFAVLEIIAFLVLTGGLG